MIWIICGPSSVGKSTFIESGKAAEFTGLPADTPTLFPVELDEIFIQKSQDHLLEKDYFIHFNILRPLTVTKAEPRKRNLFERLKNACLPHIHTNNPKTTMQSLLSYKEDPCWRNLLALDCEKKAILLASPKDIIVERVKHRITTENLSLTETNQGMYDSSFWLDIYNDINLEAAYETWCKELEECDIPYICINTSSDNYRRIDNNLLSDAIRG